MGVLHPGGIKHSLTGFGCICVFVFIREIDDFLYSALNYSLCAFIARKEGHIESGALQEGSVVAVENGIKLCMAHIGILCFTPSSFSCPRKIVVAAATRETVVSDSDDLIVVRYYASTYLSIGIFTSYS